MRRYAVALPDRTFDHKPVFFVKANGIRIAYRNFKFDPVLFACASSVDDVTQHHRSITFAAMRRIDHKRGEIKRICLPVFFVEKMVTANDAPVPGCHNKFSFR